MTVKCKYTHKKNKNKNKKTMSKQKHQLNIKIPYGFYDICSDVFFFPQCPANWLNKLNYHENGIDTNVDFNIMSKNPQKKKGPIRSTWFLLVWIWIENCILMLGIRAWKPFDFWRKLFETCSRFFPIFLAVQWDIIFDFIAPVLWIYR